MSSLLAVGASAPVIPPAHGLLVSAIERTDLEYDRPAGARPLNPESQERWSLGFIVNPENCVSADSWDPDCAVFLDGANKVPFEDSPTNEEPYEVHPITLHSSFKCSTRGFRRVDYIGRARRQLEASTSKRMEWELWTGELSAAATPRALNPTLTEGATVVGTGPYGPSQALALLGQAVADCGHGGRAFIHAPTLVASMWTAHSGLVKEDGNRLRTIVRGDTIVAGSGYPGTGPEGIAPAANTAWVYATLPVQYALSPIVVTPDTVEEALDREKNTLEYHATREVAMNFDPCCHFAILVDITSAIDGGTP